MTKPVAAFLPNRAVIRVAGADARPFLQGLVTQDILHLGARDGGFTALLTPQGKILFDFFIAPDADGFIIDCHADAAPDLLKRLTLYKLRAKIKLELAEELTVGAVLSDAAPRADDKLWSFGDPRLPALGRRVIGETDLLTKAFARFEEAGEAAYDEHRLALGAPEFGKDFDGDKMFLLDVNYDALGAVSYQKGCFVGQEVTSRMKRKGEIRKRTLIARFDAAAAAKGEPVVAGASTLGEMLSSRGPAGLAMIRLDRLKAAQEAGTEITAGGASLQIMVPDYLKQA